MVYPPSPPALLARKRRTSESTPPITKFFPTVKKQRSISESKNVSQKLEDCQSLVSAEKENEEDESVPLEYEPEELCVLLGIPTQQKPSKPSKSKLPKQLSSFETLPKQIYNHLFTILDLHSLSTLALTSQTMCNNVKRHVTEYAFYRRFQLDHLDFINSGRRLDDEDFIEHDPYYACGFLIKAITLTLDTDKRALVFLNICRNLNRLLRTNLCGFGRILDSATQCWKFSERRIMVKAAILIEPTLHDNVVRVLINKPGTLVGLEMKVRSSLTELFLNRNQEVDESSPDDIIEFGAWLSILLQNFNEKYQGKLYYLLFGPSILCRTGEKISWDYFDDELDEAAAMANRGQNVMKVRLVALLNGFRALRIMSNARRSDMAWSSKKIYRLFLRVVEVCSIQDSWSIDSIAMCLAIDTTGLLTEFLLTCCDINHQSFEQKQKDAANMICRVRSFLYNWSSTPSTFLCEPLHVAFNHLARRDGYYGGPYYKKFLDEIWKAQNARIREIGSIIGSEVLLRDELNGQLSMLRLLSDFSDVVTMQRPRIELEGIVEALLHDQDEQLHA